VPMPDATDVSRILLDVQQLSVALKARPLKPQNTVRLQRGKPRAGRGAAITAVSADGGRAVPSRNPAGPAGTPPAAGDTDAARRRRRSRPCACARRIHPRHGGRGGRWQGSGGSSAVESRAASTAYGFRMELMLASVIPGQAMRCPASSSAASTAGVSLAR